MKEENKLVSIIDVVAARVDEENTRVTMRDWYSFDETLLSLCKKRSKILPQRLIEYYDNCVAPKDCPNVVGMYLCFIDNTTVEACREILDSEEFQREFSAAKQRTPHRAGKNELVVIDGCP